MNENDFKNAILNGSQTDYVSDEALEFFRDSASFRVIDKSALEKDDVEQTEFISVALAESGDNFSDSQLVEKVKQTMCDGSRDIQKHQLRHSDSIPNTIEIWRHGNGYSAFAFAEE